ncbi:hypothetical protein KC878_01250, partial [Candidatus Saccharibacteria bacterium]|nr:hypothetical protein [Candidatus Saccharibacteria bacterium]
VQISGFKSLPEFGDSFHVVANEKEAKAQSMANVKSDAHSSNMTSTEMLRIISRRTTVDELKVLIKADVQGSLASVIDSIKSIDNDEISTRIVGSGVGNINENDVRTAAASGAIIYGFNLTLPPATKRLATENNVSVRLFKIIYELLDDIRAELENMLSPELVTTELGTLKVKGIFKTTKTEVIAGGEVLKGTLRSPAKARVIRDKQEIAKVEVTGLKRGPQDASEVQEGELCGIDLVTENRLQLEEGDRLELYTEELKDRKL